ncbi:hypothetical protein GCM10022378_03550 [Salinicoccus jeotgali]|uniref:Uncharacterized protein n=1 Tax=Salinicoccus jeotgali TaxID=381634 RepID=A0ABP7EAW0_9STAP
MRLVLFSILSLLILSSCQSDAASDDEADSTKTGTEEASVQDSGDNADTNASENEKNNEEPDAGASSEEPTEESKNNRNESTTESSDGQTDESNNKQNATAFDIHSNSVQQTLFDPDGVKTENLTFSQDVITEGMSRAEVEARYGSYDLIYPGHGGPVVIYGNLGVNYSDPGPFINEDEQTEETANPEENTVTNVMYYAGLPYEKVVDALGTPDVDVYETEGGPVSGQQLMKYEIEDKEDSTVIGTFWLHDNEAGEKIVDIMTMDDVPDDVEQVADPDSEETGELSEEEKRITHFIEGYIEELMAYYNGNAEDIMTFTRENSPNFEKISANKDSGNYRNHETYGINVKDVTQSDGNTYEVTTTRKYSHATSNGKRLTEVEYSIVETPQGFMIFDYQEVNNEPVD